MSLHTIKYYINKFASLLEKDSYQKKASLNAYLGHKDQKLL